MRLVEHLVVEEPIQRWGFADKCSLYKCAKFCSSDAKDSDMADVQFYSDHPLFCSFPGFHHRLLAVLVPVLRITFSDDTQTMRFGTFRNLEIFMGCGARDARGCCSIMILLVRR